MSESEAEEREYGQATVRISGGVHFHAGHPVIVEQLARKKFTDWLYQQSGIIVDSASEQIAEGI